MRTSRLLTTLTTATLITATAAVAPAEAATGWNRCPSGRFCVFSGTGGTGTIGIFSDGDGNLADSSGPTGLNNTIESEWNRDPHYIWIVANDASYQGDKEGYAPSSKGALGRKVSNKVSSLCRADSAGSTCND